VFTQKKLFLWKVIFAGKGPIYYYYSQDYYQI